VAGLTWPRRVRARRNPGSPAADLAWLAVVGGLSALVLGWLLTFSLQAAMAFVLVVLVLALHQYERRWGIAAMLALWLAAPMLRRLFLLATGPVSIDPLSLAPFVATAVIAGIELARTQLPTRVRRLILLAAAGFAIGVPLGFAADPTAALYACAAYLAGVSGAVLGFNESLSLRGSTLRRVLLFAMPPIAAYAIAQRFLPLPIWDRAWLESADFISIGTPGEDLRVYGSLNGPGALAPLLALSLLCYLTLGRRTLIAFAGAALLTIALSLTFVRSAWVGLIAAGLAHVIASRGRSARLVFGAAAVVVAATLALAPVSSTADNVISRFSTIGNPSSDHSYSERSETFSRYLAPSLQAPLGHGLGTAGEATRLTGESDLRAVDNGYLSLMYQVGPLGFVLVMVALGVMTVAAWRGAQARGPGQELRVLLFAMLVYLLVQLTSGDIFYGAAGVILWFIGGQVLAYEYRRRRTADAGRRTERAPGLEPSAV
jgi:O-antigen ligase